MKKLLLVLMLVFHSFLLFSQVRDIILSKTDTLKLKSNYIKECYNDSSLSNCYVLLITDGKTQKYDTICGIDWTVISISDNLPDVLKYKFRIYLHKQPSWNEFVKYINIHKKDNLK